MPVMDGIPLEFEVRFARGTKTFRYLVDILKKSFANPLTLCRPELLENFESARNVASANLSWADTKPKSGKGPCDR